MTHSSFQPSQDESYYNLEGYKTRSTFIKQLQRFDLLKAAKTSPRMGSVLIIQICNRTHMDDRLNELSRLLGKKTSNICLKYLVMPKFWERIPIMNYTILSQKIKNWYQ